MKKLICLIAVFSMCLSAAGCKSRKVQAKTYRVGVSVYRFDDEFMSLYRREMETYIKSLETDECKYEITMLDGRNDEKAQREQVDFFIKEKMDAIILNPVSPSGADKMIDKIIGADIPLVIINREPLGEYADSYKRITDNKKVCYVGSDAKQSGKFLGEMTLALKDRGDINGDDVIKYIVINEDNEDADAKFRTEYFAKALKYAGYESLCLSTETSDRKRESSRKICSDAVSKFKSGIDLILTDGEDTALGAYDALKKAKLTVGKDIYLIGADGLDKCCKMVENGSMTGVVSSDCVRQAHTATDAAIKLIKGENINNYYRIDYVKNGQ